MTQENGNWITALPGDKATFHCMTRTPNGNIYIDLTIDAKTGEYEITKNINTLKK